MQLLRFDRPDAPNNEQATAHLRVTVKDRDQRPGGPAILQRHHGTRTRRLRRVPHHHSAHRASEFGVYWPALVPAEVVTPCLVRPDGTVRLIDHGPSATAAECGEHANANCNGEGPERIAASRREGETTRAPLGLICGARSGDKGGNANVGLWTRSAAHYRLAVPLPHYRPVPPAAHRIRGAARAPL